jgi:hypothetical protein
MRSPAKFQLKHLCSRLFRGYLNLGRVLLITLGKDFLAVDRSVSISDVSLK